MTENQKYKPTRKDNFLSALGSLVQDCKKAKDEDNYLKASEILRNNQFGDRFPKGENTNESDNKKIHGSAVKTAIIPPKPYYERYYNTSK